MNCAMKNLVEVHEDEPVSYQRNDEEEIYGDECLLQKVGREPVALLEIFERGSECAVEKVY